VTIIASAPLRPTASPYQLPIFMVHLLARFGMNS
jgi:hypothetical protein